MTDTAAQPRPEGAPALSDDDIAWLLRHHQDGHLTRAMDGHPMCDEDELPWPCPAINALNALDAERRARAATEAEVAAATSRADALALENAALREVLAPFAAFLVGSDHAHEQAKAILAAEPDERGALLLEASKNLAHWLREYRGVIRVNAMRNDNDFEAAFIDDALSAWDRALRGRAPTTAGEPLP